MTTYWGWCDLDPKTPVEQKIRKAAVRYQEKHGRPPQVVVVHPTQYHEHPEIEIIASPSTPSNVFFLGPLD